ncbi:MAG: elongation factor P [Planctomycetes bacterium]|nr:elongation factor P [Planctomycetota bacterium]
MYTTSDLKKGLIIDFEGAPHLVESLSVSTPQARGGATIYKVRLRNLKTKIKTDKSFRGGETFGQPDFQKRPVQFLYRDQDTFHFMDAQSYDQFAFEREDIDWECNFLKEEMSLFSYVYNEQVIGLDLPPVVELEITETAPAVRGNSATARTKPATLETGHVIQVPEHISQGILARVDTSTGEFLGKAN